MPGWHLHTIFLSISLLSARRFTLAALLQLVAFKAAGILYYTQICAMNMH
jgi:hypothetical protein